ncbi:unnamed protein product, partial [Ixodes pacificus]
QPIANEPTDSTVGLSVGLEGMRLHSVQSLELAGSTSNKLTDGTPSQPVCATAVQSGARAANRVMPDPDTASAVPLKPQDDRSTLPKKKKSKKVYGFNVLYLCADCKERFDDASEISFHITNEHKEGDKHPSPIWQWDDSAKKYRPQHLCAVKSAIHEYSCLLCTTFLATDPKTFTSHMMSVHSQYCCIECGRIFHSKGGLVTHVAVSHRKYKNNTVFCSTLAGESAADNDHATCKAVGNSAEKDSLNESQKVKKCIKRNTEGVEASHAAHEGTRKHGHAHPRKDASRYTCSSCMQPFTNSRDLHHHAFKAHGIYSCGYCYWTTIDGLERLRLHHCVEHEGLHFESPVNRRSPSRRALESPVVVAGTVPVEATSRSESRTVATPQVEKPLIENQNFILNAASNEVHPAKAQIFKCHICEAEVGDSSGHLCQEHGVHASPDSCYCGSVQPSLRLHQGVVRSETSSGGQIMETSEPGSSKSLEELLPKIPVMMEGPMTTRTPSFRSSSSTADLQQTELPISNDSDTRGLDNQSVIATDANPGDSCSVVGDEINSYSHEQSLMIKSELMTSDVSHNDKNQEPSDASRFISDMDSSDCYGEAVGLEGGKIKKVCNSFSCNKCNQHFVSRVTLVCHMVKVHEQRSFCVYCNYSAATTVLMELHQRCRHRKHSLRYLALQGGNLRFVVCASTKSHKKQVAKGTSSSFDLSEQDLHMSKSLLKMTDRCLSTEGRRTALHNDSTGHSFSRKDYFNSKKHKFTILCSSKRIKKQGKTSRVFTLSSSDEMDAVVKSSLDEMDALPTSVEKDEGTPVAIRTYSGYRVPKSAAALAHLAHVGHRFHCCMFSCSFSTDSQSEFSDHLDGHAKSGHQLMCIYCGETVQSSSELLSHLNARHWTLQHQCALCLYRGSCKLYVQCHFAHAHQQALFTSLIVLPHPQDDHFPRSSSLLTEVTHHPYRCGFPGCDFFIRDTAAFTEHLRQSHRGATCFACSECNQTRGSIAQLMEHLTEHGFAAVQCGYCPATATTMSGILLHLCYCHAEVDPKFLIRDNDLEENFHCGTSKWTISRDAMLENSRCVEFQQRCYCCSRMLTGFRELKAHITLEHQLSPVPEELADRLFASYDYTVAVQKGRCPFCSFAAEDSVALQEHVLYQELQCIDVRHQSEGIWHEDDSRLRAWAEANLRFQRCHYVCPECPETFDTTSNLGLHVRRHYVYYPVACKLCGATLRGLVSRDRHMSQEHGLKDNKSEHCGLMPEDVSAKVQEVISRQEAGLEEHGCEQCGFKSRSSSYIEEHRLRCSIIVEDASELPLPFKCCVCRAAFSLLCPLLEHGFWQHGFSYFCTDCYFGADDEGALRKGGHPCRGRDAFFVENKQQGSRLTARSALYISQLTVVKDWEVYYKSRDFDYEGLDRLFVQLYEQKVMVVDLLGVVNFEGYVRLCDVEV